MSTEQPSRFWQKLGDEHRRVLDEHGFETCKRRQALRYFTWRWSWREIRGSEQMRFLLRHTRAWDLLRCVLTPTRLANTAWAGVDWPKRDRWLYAFATRLLWRYAARHDTTNTTDREEPDLGRPLPVRLDGRLISQDLANSALELTAIRRGLAGTQPASILEIGAGYGRTAYALMHAFPQARYTIVDIEPAIDISRWYLSQLFPAERLRFLTPSDLEQIAPGSVDLAVSISSLQEMTPGQVAHYLALMDEAAAGGWVFLKQWTTWHNPEDDVDLRFADYPIPERWRVVLKEQAPVQTNFEQAVWRVPEGAPGERYPSSP